LFVGLSLFGGAGFIFTNWTLLSLYETLTYAAILALVGVAFFYFIIIRPSERTESSTGYRLHDLVGKQGEVWVTIPSDGFGEVVITIAGGNTNHIAASLAGISIPEGTMVVIKEVKDHIIYVDQMEG
jgi:hypothetical protein